MRQWLKKYWILSLCLFGSFVRLLYAHFFEPNTHAVDQEAWELVLSQGKFSYAYLIHYPHEGGTILISLLSHFLAVFTKSHSLTALALLLDFFIRFLQVRIVFNIFGKELALVFGIWTVFASPILIPWASMNFGLHYLSSIFPFLWLSIINQSDYSNKSQLTLGLFMGFAIWFSYSNIVLIPAYLIYAWLQKWPIRTIITSLFFASVLLLIHGFCRQYFDAGFHLEELNGLHIRGEIFEIWNTGTYANLFDLGSIINNALISLPKPNLFSISFRLICYLLVGFALIGFLFKKQERNSALTYSLLGLIIFFLIIYALSPFYETNINASAISYRHLSYISASLALFILYGLHSYGNKIMVYSFLVMSCFTLLFLCSQAKQKKYPHHQEAIGYVIGLKFGHEPIKVLDIIETTTYKKQRLLRGIGWGMSSSLLKGVDENSPNLNIQVKRLNDLIILFPKSDQKELQKGIQLSFDERVQPRLKEDIQEKVLNAIDVNQ